jgi:hypothetical protein
MSSLSAAPPAGIRRAILGQFASAVPMCRQHFSALPTKNAAKLSGENTWRGAAAAR